MTTATGNWDRSIDGFSRRQGIARQTTYNEIKAGRLRTYKVGRRRLVSPEAEADWIRAREAETAAEQSGN